MNILITSDAFWPDHTGGITKSLLTKVEGLVARGHQIVVVTRQQNKSAVQHESRNGYEIYRYLALPKGSTFYQAYPLFNLTRLPRLIRALPNSSFDVVYAHDPFQMVGLLHAQLNLPLVYTFYAPKALEIEIDIQRGKYGSLTPFLRAAKPLIRMAEQQALHQADIILVHSQFMTQQMQHLYRKSRHKKVEHITLSVDTARFGFADEVTAARETLGLPTGRQILLTVRRLVGRMGLENLIDAMTQIVKRHHRALLLIGGKGYLENKLRKQVRRLGLEHNVRLLGFIPEDNLPAYYQAADLFVLPTVGLEGFGLATIESLSCGTPAIVTPVGASPEVVGPLGDEFICKDATPEGLADWINWWLGQGLSAGIRRNCREYCVSRFAVEAVVVSLEDIFERALQSKTASLAMK